MGRRVEETDKVEKEQEEEEEKEEKEEKEEDKTEKEEIDTEKEQDANNAAVWLHGGDKNLKTSRKEDSGKHSDGDAMRSRRIEGLKA